MIKKLLATTLVAAAMVSTTALAVDYTGGLKISKGSEHHYAIAWTQASVNNATAMSYVAIYESSGVKLAHSDQNYAYGWAQTETITANNHDGNYAKSRHGKGWDDAYTKTKYYDDL